MSHQNLDEYRRKRDFETTPEPSGGNATPKTASNPLFIIQKHAASTLHYDFRLEVDGVLKSWAVPKGLGCDPSQKRLAVPTEDHPLDYAFFEGVIPQNQYGGGTVMVWDAGVYQNLSHDKHGKKISMPDALATGHVSLFLYGQKLHGGYALIQTQRSGRTGRQWLIFKVKDEFADPQKDPVRDQPHSVLSQRTMEEIAAEGLKFQPSDFSPLPS